jgi:dolichyl-phosphate beta-glucosyltransferase
MDLSIVIPCLNEARRLPATLQDMSRFLRDYRGIAEIIVVDDGSSDETSAVASSFALHLPLRLLRFEQPHGKGHAVRQGMLAARGRAVLFMDADNATPLSQVSHLLKHIDHYQVVIGSRHVAGSTIRIAQPWLRRFIGRLGSVISRAVLVPGVRDTQCGFKLFQRDACQEIFQRQRIDGYGFDLEVLAISSHILKYRIKEVPVAWQDEPNSRIRPVRDAWRTLLELIRIKYHLKKGTYTKTSA